MQTFVLQGENMQDIQSMHAEIERALPLPPHYGKNLDALWDVLGESGDARHFIIRNPERMENRLFAKLAGFFLDFCRSFTECTFSIDSDFIKPGLYRHFKGRQYRLLSLAMHSETLEPMAVYQAAYGSESVWVRPASMWQETIERDGQSLRRFTPLQG